ncbi:motility associated factor glycosyltransferase family protein [Lysinibacillus xylanilyticus]|uniref:motility associated factor glycosyltransferase family protein n=1 Tax=Lysinibacillus xylanilyticus TaxID=582475 RepID=UPI003D98171C
MKWQVSSAKNDELTLELNDVAIYSKYRPFNDAMHWVQAVVDSNATHYILIGLGLGYHLKALLDLVVDKHITVYYFEEKEYEIFQENNGDWWKRENISLVLRIDDVENVSTLQILVPNPWIKAIGINHPLHNLLEIIRLKQVSYKRASMEMSGNFNANIELGDPSIVKKKSDRVACLVASGPSLNTTIFWLKKIQQQADIFVVGSALKVLENHNIVPKGVVHADASSENIIQYQGTKFDGALYYLSTANHLVPKRHQGPRFILLQKGYSLSEKYAEEKQIPLLQTGGSVGTVAFSLIEYLGYKQVILFGQDLGFISNETHVEHSTSNQKVTSLELRKVVANDGTEINTNVGLLAFLFWYDMKCQETNVRVYNTAAKGAKIKNVDFITEHQLYDLVNLNSY